MNDFIFNIRQKAFGSRQSKELSIVGFTVFVAIVVWLVLSFLPLLKTVTGLSALDENIVTLVTGVNRTWSLPVVDAVVISVVLSFSFASLFKLMMPKLSFWAYLAGFGSFSTVVLILAILLS